MGGLHPIPPFYTPVINCRNTGIFGKIDIILHLFEIERLHLFVDGSFEQGRAFGPGFHLEFADIKLFYAPEQAHGLALAQIKLGRHKPIMEDAERADNYAVNADSQAIDSAT